MNNSVYGSYRSRTFSDIFAPASGQESYDVFKDYYDNCGIPRMIREAQSGTKINSLQTLFYLLYANYGNSHIANSDESQFIYRLFSIIFMYGQAWEKRFDIQTEIKNFTEDDLLQGSKMIINHAYNNGSEPSVSELDAINEQNTQNSKRSKLDAYAYLWIW